MGVAMSFDPDQLPHPEDYYSDCGLRLAGTGKWRATCCNFCEYRALRVNVKTGAYVCTDCGASGADVLDHRMAVYDESVEQAAKALGAWNYRRAHPAFAGYAPTALSTRMGASHGI